MELARYAGLILMVAATGDSAFGAEPSLMIVRVLNQANISGKVIENMEKYVEQTLRSIHVEVKWIDCAANSNACKTLRGRNEFWLRILPQIPPAVGPDQLGFTQLGDEGGGGIQCVNLIYPRLKKLIEDIHIDAGAIIGAAAAHEIGHLYLGVNEVAHSRDGVMCANWSTREIDLVRIGELAFNREQGERIRAAMRERGL